MSVISLKLVKRNGKVERNNGTEKKSGTKLGEKIGMEKSKKEIAKNMLKLNVDRKIIKEATGLDDKEIEKISKE